MATKTVPKKEGYIPYPKEAPEKQTQPASIPQKAPQPI